MFPWLWFWAPQFHFPWSGDVAQDVDPDVYFGNMPPSAGNGRVERRAAQVASYGRQIGLLTEAVLAQSQLGTVTAEKGNKALTRLEEIRSKIEVIKVEEAHVLANSLAQQLDQLRLQHPKEFARLAKTFV
jgi:hypothetical protein